jgi:hypothetical protein
MVSRVLTLVPFAGIAFLWFIGVVRDRIGKVDDKKKSRQSSILERVRG